MIEKGRISNIQSAMLAITSLTIMGHLIVLTLVISHSKENGWIAAIIGTALGLIGIVAVTRLSQRFPGLTLIEILFRHFSWPGKIAAIVYLLYFFILTLLAVRLFGEAYKSILYETPLTAFIVIILLVSAYAVYLGLETIGRMNQIMLPILVVMAIVVAYLTMPNKDYSNLLPILGEGWMPVGAGALSVMGWFGEIVIMGMLLPYVQKPERLMKANLWVAALTLIFFLGPVTGPVAMFGATEAAKMTFPTFSEVRYIEAGEVLNRFDAIAVLFWTVGLLFRISIFYYGLCLGTAQALKLKTYRPLVLPFGWLIGAGSLWFAADYEEIQSFLFGVYAPLNITMGALLPVLLLLLSRLIQKLRKRKEVAEER
ncbi:GerAB/ArcD/ProY family transporter [Paenibacillus soyae]|uniref:Spore germination protein n=1 Tax=Paenibacillus soyae TaxID=2969249 RepID=A0A9X2MUV4_9BACL|nr:spore germination protein [Paenibacillus soyae]MCR2807446.1 spore germination protein [Paenibacillus soyae]